jgi:hypothetical protein
MTVEQITILSTGLGYASVVVGVLAILMGIYLSKTTDKLIKAEDARARR